jgi:hypothetical protein
LRAVLEKLTLATDGWFSRQEAEGMEQMSARILTWSSQAENRDVLDGLRSLMGRLASELALHDETVRAVSRENPSRVGLVSAAAGLTEKAGLALAHEGFIGERAALVLAGRPISGLAQRSSELTGEASEELNRLRALRDPEQARVSEFLIAAASAAASHSAFLVGQAAQSDASLREQADMAEAYATILEGVLQEAQTLTVLLETQAKAAADAAAKVSSAEIFSSIIAALPGASQAAMLARAQWMRESVRVLEDAALGVLAKLGQTPANTAVRNLMTEVSATVHEAVVRAAAADAGIDEAMALETDGESLGVNARGIEALSRALLGVYESGLSREELESLEPLWAALDGRMQSLNTLAAAHSEELWGNNRSLVEFAGSVLQESRSAALAILNSYQEAGTILDENIARMEALKTEALDLASSTEESLSADMLEIASTQILAMRQEAVDIYGDVLEALGDQPLTDALGAKIKQLGNGFKAVESAYAQIMNAGRDAGGLESKAQSLERDLAQLRETLATLDANLPTLGTAEDFEAAAALLEDIRSRMTEDLRAMVGMSSGLTGSDAFIRRVDDAIASVEEMKTASASVLRNLYRGWADLDATVLESAAASAFAVIAELRKDAAATTHPQVAQLALEMALDRLAVVDMVRTLGADLAAEDPAAETLAAHLTESLDRATALTEEIRGFAHLREMEALAAAVENLHTGSEEVRAAFDGAVNENELRSHAELLRTFDLEAEGLAARVRVLAQAHAGEPAFAGLATAVASSAAAIRTDADETQALVLDRMAVLTNGASYKDSVLKLEQRIQWALTQASAAATADEAALYEEMARSYAREAFETAVKARAFATGTHASTVALSNSAAADQAYERLSTLYAQSAALSSRPRPDLSKRRQVRRRPKSLGFRKPLTT